ncbi:hypothetical protein [Paracoccus sp. (in: a-proteobacteria)]
MVAVADTLAVLAAFDPLLAALLVAFAAISLAGVAIWAAVRLSIWRGKE